MSSTSSAPTWTVDPKHPQTNDCRIALYGVRWTRANGKAGSNAWRTMAEAEAAICRLTAQGATITATRITYVAGFAF